MDYGALYKLKTKLPEYCKDCKRPVNASEKITWDGGRETWTRRIFCKECKQETVINIK